MGNDRTMIRMKISRNDVAKISFFCLLFSACVTVGRHIVYSGNILGGLEQNYITEFMLTDIPVFLGVLFASTTALFWFRMRCSVERLRALLLSARPSRHPALFAGVCATCLLLAWLPYILSLAPGTVMADSRNSIMQMMDEGHPTSNHHPMAYTMIVGMFCRMGIAWFDSINAGVMMMTLTQSALMIGCLTYLMTMLYKARVSRLLIGAALVYFMLMPIFPSYAVTLWKDPPYSCMLLLYSMLLFETTAREKMDWGWTAAYAVVSLGVVMLRNNGIYVLLGTSVLAMFHLRKHAVRIALTALLAVMAFAGLNGYAEREWKVYDDFIENMAIPVQQIGYTFATDGDILPEDEEYLGYVLPVENWRGSYAPASVDALKWHPNFYSPNIRDHKQWFLRVWLRTLTRNPEAFVKAYLLETFGFWKIGVQEPYGYIPIGIVNNKYGIAGTDLFEKAFGFSMLNRLPTGPYMGSGTLLWMTLFGCLLASLRGRRWCMPYMPALMNWLTVMIATPVAFSLRYVYIFALGLPLYLLVPVMLLGKK